MRQVNHWLHEHNFSDEDLHEAEDKLKSFWETLLLVALAAMLLYTLVVVISPNLAYIISSYIV